MVLTAAVSYVFLIFGLAGVAKGTHLDRFAAALEGYAVPSALRLPAAVAVVIVELAAAAILLVWPIGLALAFDLAVALVLTAAVTIAIRRHVPCGCFGDDAAPAQAADFVRNGMVIGVAVLALAVAIKGHEIVIPFPAHVESRGPSEILAVGCGLGLAVATTRLSDFARLFQSALSKEEY